MKRKTRQPNMKKLAFDKYIAEHNKKHYELSDNLSIINLKLDKNSEMLNMNTEVLNSILNVQVNGRKGLQESLQDIYYITAELRNKRNLLMAYKEWQKTSTVGKVISTRVGKVLFTVVGTFVFLSTLNALHMIENPIDLIIRFIGLLSKSL